MSEQKQQELESKIDDLTLKVNRIVAYIDSDPATNRTGIVEQLDKLTDIVNKLLSREQIYKAKAGTFGFIGAILAGVIWKVGTLLLTILR